VSYSVDLTRVGKRNLKNHWLFAALLKIGAPVPAVDAQLPLYNRILMDIGDQQSIESSLSTFASHIARLKVIVEEADSGDLCSSMSWFWYRPR